ncbi:hypothetical protein JCGZ_03620 [Jatropha curcas]|uniref:Uncharacterized protein n=1 Tax=Jatropha curcas TaxID=180498 RepID=A0A067LAJ6_JATCU|nr:hypothetical protein JCGZ_03620 [Jatropha curcas]
MGPGRVKHSTPVTTLGRLPDFQRKARHCRAKWHARTTEEGKKVLPSTPRASLARLPD